MSASRSQTLALKAAGRYALYTRPESKVERFSYPVPTPSGARGLLEAVLWKPAIRWQIERIHVLRPILWASLRRNEVGNRASSPSENVVRSGGVHAPLIVEDERTQRNSVILRDVEYVFEARFEMTDRAGPGDNVAKFVDMFHRRVERGQHFHQPYLGCREFHAEIEPPTGDETPIEETRDLGRMLWDIEFGRDPKGKPRNRPLFFHAHLRRGVVDVPGRQDVEPSPFGSEET